MRERIRWLAAVAGLAVFTSACESGPVGPSTDGPIRTVGVLERYDEVARPDSAQHHYPDGSEGGYVRPDQPLVAPDTVARGTPFTVRVTTIGDGCTRADGAEVTTTGNLATITAYDIREGEVCTMIALFLTREVTIQFDTPGEATIRLLGSRVTNGQEEEQQRVIIEKRISVH